ncbi:DUF2267 domain-containing protein [Sediminicoccus sp. BL-A-41-H5]|uniref:DUF2267 domain-containing protein n=1 Tax=Sediminicoccus sp. BL-A-41-H5 TaxID=3421106 RepID=UPI003D666B2A
MAATGLEVWDKSIQTTNIWLDEIMEEVGPNRQAAWHALGAVLRTLRDRLPIEVAVHLGAQLPLLVRGAYFEQWHLAPHAVPVRDIEDFLDLLSRHLGQTHKDPATITASVFRTLSQHVDDGQIAKVLSVLPASIRTALSAAVTE